MEQYGPQGRRKKPLKLTTFFKALARIHRGNWKMVFHLVRSGKKRKQYKNREDLLVPAAVAISPTEECNLECIGCYSRSHPREGEISSSVLKSFAKEAVEFGVALFVITGGEPFMREDLLEVCRENKEALFVIITNGTVITADIVDAIASCGNVIPVISVEGDETMTDRRRGEGIYKKAVHSFSLFKKRNLLYGFSTVLTSDNIDYAGSPEFISTMESEGCTFGIYNELVPVHRDDSAHLPSEEQFIRFQNGLVELRDTSRAFLLFLPEDEYDTEGKCMAVGRGAMHINAQGWVEPCPFAHFARENIKESSFREILQSPFLRAIREHPTALIRNGIGCSLAANGELLKSIAEKTGASATSKAANT